MKMIIFGRPSPLIKELATHYRADMYSCDAQTDMNEDEIYKYLAKKSLDYNIVINCNESGFKQTEILQTMYELWSKKEHNGVIINIINHSDGVNKALVYDAAITGLSRYVSESSIELSLPFRCSLLAVGSLTATRKKKTVIDCKDIIKFIDLIYSTDCVIIQLKADKRK